MTKRVLVLSHFAVQEGGAGNTRHAELFGGLPQGWEPTIVSADRKTLTRGERTAGSGTMRVVPTPPFNANGASRVLNWVSYTVGATGVGLTRRHLDIVYGSSPHLLTGFAAWMIAWVRHVPFVLEIRDLWPTVLVDMGKVRRSSLTHRALRSLERFLYRRADEIVVVARGSEVVVRQVVPEASITFIPNGSDPVTWDIASDRNELRTEFGFDGFVVLYAGAHGPANGLDAVLDTAGTFADANVTFVLVGGGIEKCRLEAEAERRGLGNIRFLDPVPKHELARLFKAADVGLHVLADVAVFRYGVSPTKLFDYMAAGLPVISNCPGEVSDVVADAGAGVTCDPAGLEGAIRSVMGADRIQKELWGGNGRLFVERERSISMLAAELLVVLERATRDT